VLCRHCLMPMLTCAECVDLDGEPICRECASDLGLEAPEGSRWARVQEREERREGES